MGIPPSIHPYIATGVTLAVFLVLQVRRGTATDLLFMGALLAVTLTGVLTPSEALAGFASPAVMTVAALLAVATALRVTGVLDWVGRQLLGTARTERQAISRLAPTLIATSAFMLNTAVVAMMMPVVIDWCRRRGVSPSRLLIPLSYLTILGGVCTLVGTSTTLVANSVLRDQHAQWSASPAAERRPALATSEARRQEAKAGEAQFRRQIKPLGLFELGWVGLPCALVGGLWLLLTAGRLLPRRQEIAEQLGEQRREYLVEMLVQPDCPLIGQTVEQAGLRQLPGLFLIEIDRDSEVLTPVTPEDLIHARDRMIFTGVVSTIVDLEKIPGLIPAADLAYEVQPTRRARRRLTEVVLSRTSPLIGTTVREGNFRQRYNAAVVAVHRNGVRLTNKIGNIVLEPGDTLLLQTRSEFVAAYRNSRDFYLVSSVAGAEPRLHHKMKLAALLGLVLVVLLCLSSWVGNDPAWAAICALSVLALLLLTRCITGAEARNAVDLQMLITIAGALGLGRALTVSGAAQHIAQTMVAVAGGHPWILLIVVYLLTLVFTEAITNNAVAAMLLPIAVAVAWQGQMNPRPLIVAVTLAASLSFITPVGYQTNLMVMGPGGYRPRDFLRCGLPLAVVVMVVALIVIPCVWPW